MSLHWEITSYWSSGGKTSCPGQERCGVLIIPPKIIIMIIIIPPSLYLKETVWYPKQLVRGCWMNGAWMLDRQQPQTSINLSVNI